jgi:hypothetical protein
MKPEELQSLIVDYDNYVKDSIENAIELLHNGLVGSGFDKTTAEKFRRRGWKIAADFCASRMIETGDNDFRK